MHLKRITATMPLLGPHGGPFSWGAVLIDQSDIESRRHVRAGVVALAVVAVAILVVSLGVTRSSSGHSTIPKGAAEPSPHVTAGPIPREDGFSPFIEWINKTYPDRVGTLSHEGEQWTVPMVNPTESDTAAIQKELTDLGLKADVVSTLVSESETTQLVQTIETAVKGHRFVGAGSDASGLVTLTLSEKSSADENATITDIANRTVDQFIENLNDASRHLTREAIFAITTGPDSVPMSDYRDNVPPSGGSWINLHNSAPRPSTFCTQGYNVYNGSNRVYGITAGHCGADLDGNILAISRAWGSTIDFASTTNFYGQVPSGGNAYADGGFDVMRYPIDGYFPVACVFSGWATCRPVIGYHANATQIIGDNICGAGLGTAHYGGLGEHCGVLEYKNRSTINPDGVSLHLSCFRQHAYEGDSGGPVYLQSNGNAVAYGISAATAVIGGHEEWCYEEIADSLTAMNVSLLGA